MTLEVDRIDILNMLKGTEPNFDVMIDIPKELGHYVGGFVDDWKWTFSTKYTDLSKFSDEYLLQLYQKCKMSDLY